MKIIISIILFVCFFSLFASDNETIVITGEKEEEVQNQQKSVIGADEIEALDGATTAEIVANAMGVKISKMGGESQGAYVSIRGSSPEQVLILINGKKLNSSQGGGVNLDIIPKESIEKIEVIRGGNSALYGNSAFGGIVNIVTKNEIDSFINVKYKVDSHLSNRVATSFNKGISENIDISGNISALLSNGEYSYEHRDSEALRSNSDIKSLNSILEFKYLIGGILELNLFSSYYIDDKGVPGMVEFPSPDARMNDSSLNSSLDLIYDENYLFSMHYLKKVREYSNPTYALGEISDIHDYHNVNSRFEYDNNSIKGEVEAEYNYLDSTAYDTGAISRLSSSIFFQPVIDINKLQVLPAVRGDFLEEQDPVFSWSVGSLYGLNDSVDIRVNFSTAYRIPSFDDLFWPESAFAEGNPDLKNEKAIIYDLGFNWEINRYLSLDFAGYYHDITDLIMWNPGPSGVWSPKNLGKAEIKGIESEISFLTEVFNGYLEGRLNYTYMSALNKSDGILFDKKLINRAEHKGNLILVFNSFYDFSVSGDLSYTGLRYVTNANTKSYPGYFLLDLNCEYPFKDVIISIFSKNVLDERYEDYRGLPVPGRSFGINFEYRWDLDE